MLYRVADIPSMEADLKDAYIHRNDNEVASERFTRLLQRFTGPSTGLTFDDETMTLKISESYTADADGNIVLRSDVTGPGAVK